MIKQTKLKSILPPSATALQLDLEQATATRLQQLANNSLEFITNPDKCPSNLLPALAWAMSVDTWNENWSETTKRAVIRQAIQVGCTKGTIGAVKNALSAIGQSDIKIEEWFEYDGDPFMFKVKVLLNQDGQSLTDLDSALDAINNSKNLRSHLENFFALLENISAAPKVASGIGVLETITIYQREETDV